MLPVVSSTDINGKSISTSQVKGKIGVISTWATWNFPSTDIQRKLRKLQKQYPQELSLISICIDGDKRECKKRVDRDSLLWTIVCDEQMFQTPIVQQLGLFVVPSMVVTNKQGKIIVAAASEQQCLITQSLDEGTVNKNVNQLQQLAVAGVVQEGFVGETRKTPYIFIRTFPDGQCQFGKTLRLIHGVATGKGDIGIGVGLNDAHYLFGGHGVAPAEIPRLWVMTARTGMATSGTIDRGPETRTIYHCIFYDV